MDEADFAVGQIGFHFEPAGLGNDAHQLGARLDHLAAGGQCRGLNHAGNRGDDTHLRQPLRRLDLLLGQLVGLPLGLR